jgi:hypothetical protein
MQGTSVGGGDMKMGRSASLSNAVKTLPATALSPLTTLCPLYDPQFPLRPSVPSTALSPLYGPQSPLSGPYYCTNTLDQLMKKTRDKIAKQAKPLFLFHEKRFIKTPRYSNLFCISDNRNYSSCKVLSNNHKIAIIRFSKKKLQ